MGIRFPLFLFSPLAVARYFFSSCQLVVSFPFSDNRVVLNVPPLLFSILSQKSSFLRLVLSMGLSSLPLRLKYFTFLALKDRDPPFHVHPIVFFPFSLSFDLYTLFASYSMWKSLLLFHPKAGRICLPPRDVV